MKLIKNLFSFLLLTIFSLTFFGCSFGETFEKNPEISAEEGILLAQKNVDPEPGTHLLNLDNGDRLPLRSLTINLSSGTYLDNRVKVVGAVNPADDVFEVTGVSILERLSGDDDIIQTETYKNLELGVIFDYRNDWEKSEVLDVVTLLSPSTFTEADDRDQIVISRAPFDYKFSEEESALKQYFRLHFDSMMEITDYINYVGPNKLEAVKMTAGTRDTDYYLYRPGFIYTLSFISSNNYLASNGRAFNDLLSSFTFVPVTEEEEKQEEAKSDLLSNEDAEEMENAASQYDIANFSTFASAPYNFQTVYPSSWYYSGSSKQLPNVSYGYDLGSDPIDGNNVLISVDVLTVDIPNGKKISMLGNDLVLVRNSESNVYTSVGGHNFWVHGYGEEEDLILFIAANIKEVVDSE